MGENAVSTKMTVVSEHIYEIFIKKRNFCKGANIFVFNRTYLISYPTYV